MNRLALRSTLAATVLVSLLLTMSWSPVESGAPPAPSGQTGALFYYADGQRIPLTPSPGEIALRFKAGASQDQKRQVFESLGVSTEAGRKDTILEIPNPRLTIVQVGLVGAARVQSMAADLSPQPQIEFAHPLFVFDNDDTKLALTDEFLVQFKAGVSRAEIQALNARHGVEIVEETFWAHNNFTLRITSASDLDVLAMANLYHESPLTQYAGPNFVRLMKPLAWPNDTYIGDQWSLRNTGQHGGTVDADIDADEAWDMTTGSADMTIAIIDEGVETGHEDLRGNMAQGYDVPDGDDDPTPRPWDAHGTNCAGIAAAMGDNGRGVAGVAWGSRIMPIRIAYTAAVGGGWVTYDSWVANAINWAWQHGADVLSNSWGGGSPSSQITTAINNAKTQGRDGKGSVVVFAAGNANGPIIYPATLSTVMAVGATNLCDQRKTPIYNTCNYYEGWGSNYGPELDISAPGVALHSTDNSLAAGYGNSSYSSMMNGTSGATPHVAGAAALVLSVNPTLTASQVESLLTSNADDKGSPGWDQYYGWGRLNAHRAVSNTTHYLQLTSDSLNFTFEDSSPATLDLDIVNPATSSGTWNAVCTDGDCFRISVGSPTGNTPSKATVTANKPASYGTYYATIQVSSTRPSSMNSPQTVNVTISRVSSISEVYLPLILRGSSGSGSGPSLDIGFSDDMESGIDKWTAQLPWGLTTTEYNSYNHSWADSPSGSYSNNRRSLTLTSIPFSLAGIGSPQMMFYHYYSIEYNWDYGLVEVSSDGLNWETVGVYTGYHSYWAQETINLSAYANSPYLRVRFRFESDALTTDDGWYVDDVTVSD